MKNRFSTVEAIMPPKTVVPTECRPACRAPVASTSGSTPRMKANDVIRIGRRRMRAASTAASTIGSPRAQLLRELHDQDGVLAGEADQHHQADLAVDVVLQARAATARPARPGRPSAPPSGTMNGSTKDSYWAASVR
jgi:hypothetical protein